MPSDPFEPLNGLVIRRPCLDGPEITSLEDWKRLAPPAGGERHWCPGRSALECARAWFRGGGVAHVPSELQAVLGMCPDTTGFRVATVCPEHKTRFSDGPWGPRNHDALILGKGAGYAVPMRSGFTRDSSRGASPVS